MPGKSPGPSAAEEEVQITFVRAKNGKKWSIPVWFTLNTGKMELLPMYGSRTKWLMDVERSGKLSLAVRDWKKDVTPNVVRDRGTVDAIKRRFAVKYGEDQVRRYYPSIDVAVEASV